MSLQGRRRRNVPVAGSLAKRLFCILLNEAPWPTQAPTADLMGQVDVMGEVDSQIQ